MQPAHDAHQPLQHRLDLGARQHRFALGGDPGAVEIGLHLHLHRIRLRLDEFAMRRLEHPRFVDQDGDRRLQRMGEIADLHAGTLDDAPVAVDQRVDFAGQRLDFARKFAVQPFAFAAADLFQRPARLVERPQPEEDGQRIHAEAAEDRRSPAPDRDCG